MKTPRPTKNAERGAPDKRNFTGIYLLALAYTAINHAMLRCWCASPTALLRGTIRPKPKGPARKNVLGKAVAAPTDKRGFAMSKFWGLVRLHLSQSVYGHGGGYPQGRPHGFTRVLNRHAHPLRVRTQRVVLKSRKGATTMSTSSMASRSAVPTTTPTTSEAQAFALLQATSDATMAKLYLSRGNIPAARRKAVQLLKALQGLSKSDRAQASASPCTDCRDNFPLPSGPLDFFDTQVVAEYVVRRTACTLCRAADKPCLKGGDQ